MHLIWMVFTHVTHPVCCRGQCGRARRANHPGQREGKEDQEATQHLL